MFLRVFFFAVVLTNGFPWCLALSNELKIINAINASDYLCILLWLPGAESSKVTPWTANLPFTVQAWTHLGHQHIQILKDYNASYRKVVVAVPSSSEQERAALFQDLREDIMFIPLVRLLFILKPGDPIPNDNLGELSCAVIYVNETTIDIPEDSYKNCSKRVATREENIFKTEKTRGWTLLKGKSMVVLKGYKYEKQTSISDCTMEEYGSSLLVAFKHINVTVKPFISDTPYEKQYPDIRQALMDALHKKFDFSCHLVIYDEAYQNFTDVSAVTHMGTLNFHTATGRRLRPTMRFGFGTLRISSFLGMLAAMILAVHFLRGRILDRPTSTLSVAFLLYAFIFGQYPKLPQSSRNTITVTLLVFWSGGVVFLSSYIMSDFTSEVSVPGFSKSIETLDDLEHVVKLKHVRPCVAVNLHEYALIMKTSFGILGSLRDSLIECGDGCTQSTGTSSECFEKVRKGTHVFVRVAIEPDPNSIRYPGVCSGAENFGAKPITYITTKAFPYRQEHHRVVRTITEARLYVPLIKKANYTEDEEEVVPLTQKLEFKLLFLLSCGCIIGFVILLVELALSSKASRSNQLFRRRRAASKQESTTM